MTGAPVPEGADAVVMVEHVERAGSGCDSVAEGTEVAGWGEYCAAWELRLGQGRWCWRWGR